MINFNLTAGMLKFEKFPRSNYIAPVSRAGKRHPFVVVALELTLMCKHRAQLKQY